MAQARKKKDAKAKARRLLGTGMAGEAADRLKAARKRREEALRKAGG